MSRKSAERLLLSLLPLLLQPLLEGKLLAVLPLPPTLSFQGGVQWRKSSASLSKPQKAPPHQACVPGLPVGRAVDDEVPSLVQQVAHPALIVDSLAGGREGEERRGSQVTVITTCASGSSN